MSARVYRPIDGANELGLKHEKTQEDYEDDYEEDQFLDDDLVDNDFVDGDMYEGKFWSSRQQIR